MRAKLLEVAEQAIRACRGDALCCQALDGADRSERTHLVAVGKAAAAMARGVLAALDVASALVVTKEGHHEGFAPPGLELRFAGHPEPDARSAAAAARTLARVERVASGERLIAALSGGGSSLLAAPLPGLGMAELSSATRALLGAGVGIEAINIVRRHLTRASGGRLAQACAGRVQVLVISDVLSGDLSAIASGPFAPDPSSFAEALAIARGVPGIGEPVLELLRRGAAGELAETAKPGDPCFSRVEHRVLASHDTLREAARRAAGDRFEAVRMLPPTEEDVARVAERLAIEARELPPGAVLIGGGEPVVSLPRRHGLGGRSQQLALHLAKRLAGGRPITFAAVCSDGGDGPTDAAGAVVDETSWHELGEPDGALDRADAYPVLDRAGLLLRTGPTATNVLDLHLLAAR